LADVNAGKLKPHYKSESKPLSDMDEDGVTVLTGDTFEEKVMNSKNDVFVLFYAPWCGHCKKLAPIWAELAQKVQKSGWDTKGVMIASWMPRLMSVRRTRKVFQQWSCIQLWPQTER